LRESIKISNRFLLIETD